MEIRNSVDLPYARQVVWDDLNDPDILRACIPGCESFEAPTSDHFDVVSVLKIGMIKARFEGEVDLIDIDAPNSYRIKGAGKGGVAGYASGSAKVWLEDADGGTRLNYEATADVGGKIAQMGSRLIDTVANQMAAQFFESFKEALARREAGESLAPQADGSDAAPSTSAPSAVSAGARSAPAPKSSHDWLLPYFVGLGCGVLIGAFAALALG